MSAPAIIMKRTIAGLSAATAFDAEELDRISIGATVEVTVRQRRSVLHHRWFFLLLSRLVKAGAVPFSTTEELLDACKMACGVTQLRQSIGGAPYYVPGSISFAAKDQTAFKEFADKALALIANHYRIDIADVLDDRSAA